MALKLSLKPGEKIAINGAVIVNGDRRSIFTIENLASVLRDRDIMQADEATTPAKRIYFPVMMMALNPDGPDAPPDKELNSEFQQRLEEFAGAISDPDALNACLKINALVANHDYYKALTLCRTLIDFEKSRLSDVA